MTPPPFLHVTCSFAAAIENADEVHPSADSTSDLAPDIQSIPPKREEYGQYLRRREQKWRNTGLVIVYVKFVKRFVMVLT